MAATPEPDGPAVQHAIDTLLDANRPPTAIVTGSDVLAAAVYAGRGPARNPHRHRPGRHRLRRQPDRPDAHAGPDHTGRPDRRYRPAAGGSRAA
jgi:hypothetical protein